MTLDQIQKFCLSKPGATMDIKWEKNLVFSVGEKMFCSCGLNPPFVTSFKVEPEQYNHLIEQENIVPAPYLARAQWVQIQSYGALNTKEWKALLSNSYLMVKSKLPKKVQAEIG